MIRHILSYTNLVEVPAKSSKVLSLDSCFEILCENIGLIDPRLIEKFNLFYRAYTERALSESDMPIINIMMKEARRIASHEKTN